MEGHARLLERVLLKAREGSRDAAYDAAYVELRRRMTGNLVIKPLLPSFILKHRDLGHLWPYLESFHPQWEPRGSMCETR